MHAHGDFTDLKTWYDRNPESETHTMDTLNLDLLRFLAENLLAQPMNALSNN